MNDWDDLQDAKEEAEFLRKRAWDFIDRLEKRESELNKTIDADKRKSLQIRIKNTRRLLEDYQVQYKALCEEMGIAPENLIPNAPARDIVSIFSRKALKTREDLIRRQEIDLPPFFLVPSRNPKFTGRQNEVRDFIKMVLTGGAFAICGVKGMGGIGKTEIAKEVCHLFHETWQAQPQLPEFVIDLLSPVENGFFCDGMLWIQFEPEYQTPKSLTEYLFSKLPNFQTGKIKDEHKTKDEADKDKPDLDFLVDILANKDILVVLDSVEQNLRTFDYVLERFKGRFPLIITSRIAIPGIHAVDIDMLRDEEAEALFINHLENSVLSAEQRETVTELCELLGNYPLIIKIIASRVETDNSNLAELKATYQDNRALLLEESGRDTGIEKRNADVKTCFMMSYRSLDEPEQHAFLHTALFNNPFTVSALAALLDDTDEREMQQIVKRLQRLSLFNRLQGKNGQATTYDLHPLMREFALDLLMQPVETIPGKKEEITTLLESLQKAEKHNKLLEMLKDRTIVQQAAEAMDYCNRVFDFTKVQDFMYVLNDPIDTLGYWNEKIRLNRLAVRATVALQQRSSEAKWRIQFADTLQRKAVSSAELEQARRAFEQALLIVHELKQMGDVLYSQYSLANIERFLQQWTAAVRSNYQGIREACRYGEFYELAGFIRTIGQIHDFFMDEQASLFFCINLKMQASNAKQDSQKYNLLNAYEDNIDALYNRGKIEACLPRYQQQLQLAQTLNDAEMVARSIKNLFYCYLHLQNPQACQHYLQDYIQLSTKMGLAESTRQTITGKFAWLNGDYAAAVEAFSAALTEDDLNQDELHYWLGKAYLYQGDLDAAADYLNKALEHYRTHKIAVEMAKVYSQLALLALKHGETQQAVLHFSTSLKTQQAHGVEISPEEIQIQQAIREQLAREGTDAGLYESLAAQAQAIDLKPDFLLSDLPKTYTGKDGKPMLLISAGPVFIGKGEIETPTTEELLDNIEQYMYPYKQRSGDYQLSPHPDSVFDEDKFLFLLEKSTSMSTEEKQQTLDKISTMPEEDIQELIEKLDEEYQKAIPEKATEIYLYPYYIDSDPVSNAEYQAFCAATKHTRPAHWIDSNIPDNAADLPVVNISLEDAKAYAQWAGKEIPTSPEWEKACRGERGALYPWGDEWDENRVKAKDGSIRKQFEAEYLELNATIPKQGGLVRFKTPRFSLPTHSLKFDGDEFLNYLQGSLSWSADEKRKIIEGIPSYTQAKIDQLKKTMLNEKVRMSDWAEDEDKWYEKYVNSQRKGTYIELMQPELLKLYLPSLHETGENSSPYGIHNLVGSIYQMTVSEDYGDFAIKGGSWFSENPQEECKAWAEETIKAREKRMDVGFRCVKPIFG
jgi:tetratricopeptide (TPR) repeat protein